MKSLWEKAQKYISGSKSSGSKSKSKSSSNGGWSGVTSGGSLPPGYAKGGIFNGASNIIIGEKGLEAAVPLKGHRMKPFAAAIASQMPNGGGGSGEVNINVSKLVVREEADVQKVAQELHRLTQRSQRAKGVQ